MIDISGKIDPVLLNFYASLVSVAKTCSIKFFVVGATARDMILTHGYGIAARRMTEDVDIGVNVTGWDDFSKLKFAMLETGDFADTGAPQRLRYKGILPVDLVPFGAIESLNSTIEWPPDQVIHMNVFGFRDVLASVDSIRMRDDPVLDVPIASLAGLALLKISAWSDRGHFNAKDATDLAYIIQVYLDAGNHERLHEEHPDLLVDDFDYERAGAHLLGRDIAAIAGTDTRARLLEILHAETGEQQQYRMIEAMVRGASGLEADFDRYLHMLESLCYGLDESVAI